MMDVITSCVLQVFQKHVSNVSFVFRRTLQLLHLDVSKLDRVLYLSPRFSAVSPWCQTREGGGGPHWLEGRRSTRDVGGQAQDARRGKWRGRPDSGLASRHPGASHAP